MKQFILSCLVVACLLSACNNNKTVKATSDDGKTKVEVAPVSQVSEAMKKRAEELQQLTPLTMDELKALLPETIMGAKKSDFQVSSAAGTGMARAEYDLNDTTEIEVNVFDCSGAAGSGLYSTRYLAMFMNIQSESADQYTKTIDFKGEKAIENCRDNQHRCTLTYFGGKRFMIVLEGKNVHPDGLKQAANELNI